MTENLEEYNRKRHFNKTNEPHGELPDEASTRRRFVVQHHRARSDHYDFRLELDHVLKSWAVPKGPSCSTHDKRLAIQVEDHPFDYRDFEGTIPQGEYGGGTVMLWDEGYWEPVGDPEEGLAKGDLKFSLYGSRLNGRWVLVHIKPRAHEKDVNWLLIKEKDEYADGCDLRALTTSVRTGRTMEEIAAGAPPVGTDGIEGQDRDDVSADGSVENTADPVSREVEIAADRLPFGKHDYPDGLMLAGIEITHPEKIIYPEKGLTKGDIAQYYLMVSDRMLPYMGNRLLSIVRCPKGIGTSCFYKKHPQTESEGIGVVPLTNDKGTAEDYFYIKNIKGVLHEVQMNTLEFHVWGSRVDMLEQPDMMVFDLDPDEGMGLDRIRQGVRDAKSVLDDLSLTAFLKTTGGKGYHIVIPLKPTGGWPSFKGFAQNIAKLMEAKWPERYTSNSRKNERHGRIYIDWQRNIRGATSVAPYSVRDRKSATVSMPIRWDELDAVAPDEITIIEALERLSLEDPWEGFSVIEQELAAN